VEGHPGRGFEQFAGSSRPYGLAARQGIVDVTGIAIRNEGRIRSDQIRGSSRVYDPSSARVEKLDQILLDVIAQPV
jgi:hypothetical protein